MPRVSLAFFSVGAVCGLLGMIWGTYMGASEDFSARDAHAHLNLLGWVTLSLMGTFYALAGSARPKLLSWVNFVLSSVGVPLFVAFLVTLQTGTPNMMVGWAGVLMVIFGMTTFIIAILLVGMRRAA
jgi:hypothetical protein